MRLTFWTVSHGGEEEPGTALRANKTGPFFLVDCNRWALVTGQKGPEGHKAKAQGSHISPRLDHRVKLHYFKHVWMLLAHQGETTVTGLARQLQIIMWVSQHVKSAQQAPEAEKKNSQSSRVNSERKTERTDLCKSETTDCKKTIRQSSSIHLHLLTLDESKWEGGGFGDNQKGDHGAADRRLRWTLLLV